MQVLKTFALMGLLCAAAMPANAAERADFTGVWITNNGDGAAELRPCGDNLCGYVYSILKVPDPSKPLRDNNNEKPALRSRALCGLQVLGGLKKVSDNAFGDGWVYDPETGKQYSVEITLKGSTLDVRGYVGSKMFGKTVTWPRAASAPAKCTPLT